MTASPIFNNLYALATHVSRKCVILNSHSNKSNTIFMNLNNNKLILLTTDDFYYLSKAQYQSCLIMLIIKSTLLGGRVRERHIFLHIR